MSGFDPDALAAHLLAARRARRVLALPPPHLLPPSLAAGIAAQRALARIMGADSPAGFPAGFKVGATAQTMQDYLGLPGPLAGFMPETGLHGSGSTLAYAGFVAPGVECEIAVHLGHDLPAAPCTTAQAAEAVDGVMAAIELVELRYPDVAAVGASVLVADQVFHAAAVLGTPETNWRALDLDALPGRILVDGEERGHGLGRDLLGGPLRVLAWLAASEEAAAFGGLRAGQVVMLGSVTPPIWLDGPCRVEVLFPPLEPAVVTVT